MPGPRVVPLARPAQPAPEQESGNLLVEVAASLLLLVWEAVTGAAVLVRRYPVTAGAAGFCAVAWWYHRLAIVAGVLSVVMLALAAGALVRPRWWETTGAARGRRYCRKRRVARRWAQVTRRLDLVVSENDWRRGRVLLWTPKLSRLRWVAGSEILRGRVHLLTGQAVSDFADVGEGLATAVGAESCRVVPNSPGVALIEWVFGDPLLEPVSPLPVGDDPDLAALPVGRCEDGGAWQLRLAGTHVLIAGVTGAGKGSVIWSLLRAVAPAVRSGAVEIWAVDGKGGMELAAGRPLFARFATSVEDGVDLLEDAASLLTERSRRLAGVARVHAATPGDPLVVVLVDEVALLTAYVPDRKLRDRAEKALALIATQGRAPGVALVAALQDPRKEVLGLRNLFPTRIAMRLDEKSQVDMVLGDGAREAGANCHQISPTLPGVAYVRIDGQRDPIRVRASYLDDAAIAALAERYAPRAAIAPADGRDYAGTSTSEQVA